MSRHGVILRGIIGESRIVVGGSVRKTGLKVGFVCVRQTSSVQDQRTVILVDRKDSVRSITNQNPTEVGIRGIRPVESDLGVSRQRREVLNISRRSILTCREGEVSGNRQVPSRVPTLDPVM